MAHSKCIYLRGTTWCLDICLHCEMITAIKTINTYIIAATPSSLPFPSFLLYPPSLPLLYLLVLGMRTLLSYPLSKSQAYNSGLFTIVITLYIKSPELNSYYNQKFVSFEQHLPISPTPAPGNHHSILFTMNLHSNFFYIPHISEIMQYLPFRI